MEDSWKLEEKDTRDVLCWILESYLLYLLKKGSLSERAKGIRNHSMSAMCPCPRVGGMQANSQASQHVSGILHA